MGKRRSTSEIMIQGVMTLASLPILVAMQMATGTQKCKDTRPAIKERKVATKRYELVVVGRSYSSQIFSDGENHVEALDNEIEYRKKYTVTAKELPIYARIIEAGTKLPPAIVRS